MKKRARLVTFQSRIVRKSVDTPLMLVRQLPVPPITCVRVDTTGDTADEQRAVALELLRVGDREPVERAARPGSRRPPSPEPGMTMMRFVPRLLICCSIIVCAPLPTATMTITAPTPITMPSIVSSVRILFLRMLCDATLSSVVCLHAASSSTAPSASGSASAFDVASIIRGAACDRRPDGRA